MAASRQQRRRSQSAASGAPISFKAGPWIGCSEFSATSRFLANEQLAQRIVNGMIIDAREGADIVSRPGATRHTQLGAGSVRNGQCIYEHVALDGTKYVFWFVGGKVYRWNKVVGGGAIYTDVTPVGVTISPTNRIFCTSFDDKLVVTDSSNRPWYGTNLGSTPITATYVQYNTAGSVWCAYGRPQVYGAKLFFIANVLNGVPSRTTLLWSEEADVTTGYRQDGFSNFWELSQTDQSPIYAIQATNVALYYFREQSIGAISGDVAADFATTATHDAITTTVGTTSPATVTLVDRYIYFTDRHGRPFRFALGGEIEPIWEQSRGSFEVYSGNAAAMAGVERNCCAAYYPEFQLVLFVLPTNSGDPSGVFDVWSTRTNHYLGQWWLGGAQVGFVDTVAAVHDSSGVNRLAFLGSDNSTQSYGGSTVGYPWIYGTNRDGVHTDNAAAFDLAVDTHYMGLQEGEAIEYLWTYLNAAIRESAATITVVINTSQDAGNAVFTANVVTDMRNWQLAELGLNRHGRWLYASIFLRPTTTPVRITRVTALARPRYASVRTK